VGRGLIPLIFEETGGGRPVLRTGGPFVVQVRAGRAAVWRRPRQSGRRSGGVEVPFVSANTGSVAPSKNRRLQAPCDSGWSTAIWLLAADKERGLHLARGWWAEPSPRRGS